MEVSPPCIADTQVSAISQITSCWTLSVQQSFNYIADLAVKVLTPEQVPSTPVGIPTCQ
jgi:hypothetical protein